MACRLPNSEKSIHCLWPICSAYFPADYRKLEEARIEVHYLGYYLKWTPQECYYYAVEHSGFQARPSAPRAPTASTTALMTRLTTSTTTRRSSSSASAGRPTMRRRRSARTTSTREEGVALVRRFDGEFPERYFQEVMDYLGMTADNFHKLCDEFRSPHLWSKESGEWRLKHQVS